MEIVQKKGSNKATFLFKDDRLQYSIKDSNGKQSFTVEYGDIPYEDFSELEEKNSWYRDVGILWCGIGLFITGMRFIDGGSVSISMWVPIGFICLLIYWFMKTMYTILDTNSGRIFVIKDKDHDRILESIDNYRKKQWNNWYNTVNFDNESESEIGKFRWLFERGVIDEKVLNQRIQEISSHHGISAVDATDGGPTIN